MAFVNEYVSDEDVKKYGLEEINRRYSKVDIPGRYSWTVDRERNIYLRKMRSDKDAFWEDFTFFWQGELLAVRLSEEGTAIRGGTGTTRWKLIHLVLTDSLTDRRDEILAVLKEALRAYKTAGVYSAVADHTAIFEF